MFNKNTPTPSTERDVRNPLGGRPLQQSPLNAPPASLVAQPEAPVSTAETESGARLIVGPNVKLKGAEILDCDTLVVEGRVEATMDSRVLRIAANGSFSGKVSIDVAEIHGQFDGELTARQQLVIHATGKVNGQLRYGKLLVEEGGQLSGDVRSLSAEHDKPLSRRDSAEISPLKALASAAG